jgi:hypothetical protein
MTCIKYKDVALFRITQALHKMQGYNFVRYKIRATVFSVVTQVNGFHEMVLGKAKAGEMTCMRKKFC